MITNDVLFAHLHAGTPVTEIPITDCHCHLGPYSSLRMLDPSIEGVLRCMDRMGIRRTALSATMSCVDGVIGPGNDLVIDAVQRFPQRIIGYTAVNPQYPAAAAAELVRCLAAGLRAIKVHSSLFGPYDAPEYDPVWAFAGEHGLPVLAHTWADELTQLEAQFARYPQVQWMMAHAGGATPSVCVRAAREYPNVFIDLVYSPCPRGLIEYFIGQGIEDKLLWGTDMPFMAGAPQLGKVLTARITVEQKAKILGLNARRIFGDE